MEMSGNPALPSSPRSTCGAPRVAGRPSDALRLRLQPRVRLNVTRPRESARPIFSKGLRDARVILASGFRVVGEDGQTPALACKRLRYPDVWDA